MSEETLPRPEQLKALLYQYVNLYERWSEDRQVFAEKGADLSQVLQDFQKVVESLKSLGAEVQSQVTEHLDRILPAVKEVMLTTGTEAVQEKLKISTQRFEDIVQQTEQVLQKSLWEGFKSRVLWVAITLVGAAAVGLVVAKGLLPSRLYQLTPYQVHTMYVGNTFELLLQRLSPIEKKRLMESIKALEKKHKEK